MGRVLHDLLELVDLALADLFLDQRARQQDFQRHVAPVAVYRRNQLLRHHRLEVEAQIEQDLSVALLREEMEDSVHRLVGVVGVQGGQTQVTGFGEGDGMLHRLACTDFADQDHIGRLAQGVAQRDLEGIGIDAHLALGDDAAPVPMDVLDRVLDRDDVAGGILVAVTDHRGQRGRLAGTGRTDHHDDAALDHRQVAQRERQIELFEGRNLGLDATTDHADGTALVERAHAEPCEALDRDRVLQLPLLLELLHLVLGHGAEHDAGRRFLRQGFAVDRPDLAVDLEAGRRADGDEQVRSALFVEHLQPTVDHAHAGISRGSVRSDWRFRRRRVCRPPCGALPAWQRARAAPGRPGSDPAWSCRRSGRSGSPNTSARPCPRGSGSGSPAWRS